MYRVVARTRTLIALLLLVAGQLAAAAQATCPRAALRRSMIAASSTTRSSTAVVAFVSERHHHTSSPAGDLPAAPFSSCGSVTALPEQAIEYLPPIPPIEDALARVTSPPGDPFASSFFRPPRLS
jgi:hypothetical protein